MRKNKKLLKKILLIDCFILVAIISMLVVMKNQKKDKFIDQGKYETLSLAGIWYKVELDTLSIVSMTDEGTYTEKDEDDKLIKSGTYEIGNHALKIDGEVYSMNFIDEAETLKDKIDSDDLSEYELRKYFYTLNENDKKIYYFSDETAAIDQIEDNCSINEYYEKVGMFDDSSFAIDSNGLLLAYTGKERELMIPANVAEISENAMSADYGRALDTYKVTIPGTVRKIASGAFSFSNIKQIYIEQGVEEIEAWAFGDSNIEEIHFPYAVKNMEEGILDTEEGLEGLKIFCQKDSPVDIYLKNYPPKGDYEIIYN